MLTPGRTLDADTYFQHADLHGDQPKATALSNGLPTEKLSEMRIV